MSNRGYNIIDILDQTFGYLRVIGRAPSSKGGRARWLCRCYCGRTVGVESYNLRNGKSTNCGCRRLLKFDKSRMWKGFGEISSTFWRRNRSDKVSRNKDALTIEYGWDLFLRQTRRCALTGLSLSFPAFHKDTSATASLDRIDSSLGYIPGNVQWVHKDINMMKNKYDQQYFINMCQKVANHATSGLCEV